MSMGTTNSESGFHGSVKWSYLTFLSVLWSLVDAPLITLLFLGIVFHVVGQHTAPHTRWPKRLGLSAFLTICLYGFLTLESANDLFGLYLALGFRAFLVLLIVQGAAAIGLALLTGIWWQISRLLRSVHRGLTKTGQTVVGLLKRPPPPEAPPAPLPEPPSLQQLIDQAKRDYETTCEALRSAGLDKGELDQAFLFERQKYVRGIYELRKR